MTDKGDMVQMAVSEIVRRHARESGLSVRAISKLTGDRVSKSTVQEFMKGRTITVPHFDAIAEAVKVRFTIEADAPGQGDAALAHGVGSQ